MKLKSEAEAMKSACDEKARMVCQKQTELENRERELQNHEANLSRKITTKATEITKEKREKLEQDFNSRKNEMENSYEEKKASLSKQYKKMTMTYKVEFTALLSYGLISTVMQILTTPVIVDDFISFFRGLWNGVTGFVQLANDAGTGVAGIADYIPNPSASTILHGFLYIVVTAVIIGVVGIGILYIAFAYWDYMHEHQWDRHTVIVIVVILAVTLFLSEEIASLNAPNLLLIQIAAFLAYSGIRAWVHHKKGYVN